MVWSQHLTVGPDVMLTHGGTLIADRVAKESGKAIPVVFAISADPVGAGSQVLASNHCKLLS